MSPIKKNNLTVMNRFFTLFFSVTILSMGIARAQHLAVMTKDTYLQDQTYFYSGDGFSFSAIQNDVDDYLKKGYYINTVSYTSFGWGVAMSKGGGFKSQTYTMSVDWPEKWIQKQRAAGKSLTSLHYSGSVWFAVASVNSRYGAQEIASAPWESLKEWISIYYDSGYYITDIAAVNGLWTVVMTETDMYTAQKWFFASSRDELEARIKDGWAEGYRITAAQYSAREWFCIMSQLAQDPDCDQTYVYGTDRAETTMKKFWEDGYKVTYIGG